MKNLIIIITTILLSTQFIYSQTCTTYYRPSVTFILGEDEKESDRFYALAKEYYLTDDVAQTDYFVDNCRSLHEVRNYLANRKSDSPWGTVNLVLHGNQWTGISIPVMPQGERTTVTSLFASIQNDEFNSLPDDVADEYTMMNFVSCGLGKNKDLMYALQLAFGGFDDHKPDVFGSENFVYFNYNERQQVEISQVKPFYAFYKTAYKPADLHLRKQLQHKYPKVDIDWLAAMSTKQPSKETNIFHTKFNVPIQWNVALDVPAERVEIVSEYDKIEFVRAQDDLMEVLDKFDIPIEKFRWQLSITEQEGKARVKINGKSTVLCVLTEG